MRKRETWLKRGVGAAIGVLSAGAALGIAQLVAAWVNPGSSPVVAVGGVVVDNTPEPVKEFAIRTFGEADKLVLVIGILVLLAGFAVLLGILTLRRLAFGVIGVVVFGAIGVAAAMTRADAVPPDALPSLLGTAAGIGALTMLARASRLSPKETRATVLDRRAFLGTGAAVAVVAGFGGWLGTRAGQRSETVVARQKTALPEPANPAHLPDRAQLNVRGISPFVTPNDDFYRVDTAIAVPQLSPREWSLRIHGMVDREIEMTYGELLRRPLIERYITLNCVSNVVGGRLIGNAKWLGLRLGDLLRDAGVSPRSDQIIATSNDGWTCGTPTEVVMDGRDAMLAIAMNDEPLPVEHGFPVRVLVPELYGYVSATKWVVDLNLTRFADTTAYWVSRGWAAKAPVKTASRIDVPRAGQRVSAGRVDIAGVAWAQHRGIDAVEVRVDNGPWQEARLAAVPGIDTWRQWTYAWDAEPGSHRLQVRATDGTGHTQTGTVQTPKPDGATGWHTVMVDVA